MLRTAEEVARWADRYLAVSAYILAGGGDGATFRPVFERGRRTAGAAGQGLS